MCALFVVKEIEQDIVAGRVNRIIRATNPQPENFIFGVKRRVFFRLIGGWFISRRRRFSAILPPIPNKISISETEG